MLFRDRADAGRRLAAQLKDYADRPDVLVLALPLGGAAGDGGRRRLGVSGEGLKLKAERSDGESARSNHSRISRVRTTTHSKEEDCDDKKIPVPALFVYGDRDIHPSWPVEQAARLMPDARFELIEGAEHVIRFSHPEELKSLLQAFVGDIVRRGCPRDVRTHRSA